MCRGCVTPLVVHNWNESAGGDMELVDGYEELPAEAQEKVRRTFQQGHVDDEDWNGVSLRTHLESTRHQSIDTILGP